VNRHSGRRQTRTKTTNGSPVLLQQVSRTPVQWTKTTAVCTLLKSDLTGSGQGRTTIALVRNGDGTFKYKTNEQGLLLKQVQNSL
jgi:hypothetical protein